jgi:hypothetical protein
MKIVDNKTKYNSKSISNYKKTDLIRELEKELINGDYKKALYYSSEMFASGYFKDLFITFFIFISEYIHILNPNLYSLIFSKYETYRDLEKKIKKNKKVNLLDIRNHPKLQNDLLFITKNLCLSPKRHISYFIPESYNNQTSGGSIDTKLMNITTGEYEMMKDVINNRDNKDIIIAIKEFQHHFNSIVKAKINGRGQNSNDINKSFFWLGRIFFCGCEQNYFIGYPHQISIYSTNDKKINDNFINVLWNLILNAAKIEKQYLNNIISIYSIYEDTLLNKNEKKSFLMLHSLLYFMFKNGDYNIRYELSKNDRDLLRRYYKSIQYSINKNIQRPDYFEINEEKIKKKIEREKKERTKRRLQMEKAKKKAEVEHQKMIQENERLEEYRKKENEMLKLKSFNMMSLPTMPGMEEMEYDEEYDKVIVANNNTIKINRIKTVDDTEKKKDADEKKDKHFTRFMDALYNVIPDESEYIEKEKIIETNDDELNIKNVIIDEKTLRKIDKNRGGLIINKI